MSKLIGVLALQGAFQKHVDSLSSLGIESRLIRNTAELDDCDGLIIPGGESTTMSLLAKISWLTRSRLEWDPQREQITNNEEANAMLHYEYREPWELG